MGLVYLPTFTIKSTIHVAKYTFIVPWIRHGSHIPTLKNDHLPKCRDCHGQHSSQEGYGFGMTEVLVLFLESPLEVAGTINLSSALGKHFNLTFSDLSYFANH